MKKLKVDFSVEFRPTELGDSEAIYEGQVVATILQAVEGGFWTEPLRKTCPFPIAFKLHRTYNDAAQYVAEMIAEYLIQSQIF